MNQDPTTKGPRGRAHLLLSGVRAEERWKNKKCTTASIKVRSLAIALSIHNQQKATENWPLFCSFRSSACTIKQRTLPLPPYGVILTSQIQDWEHSRTQIQDWEHSREDYITTDYFEYRRNTFNVTIVYSRRADLSVLTFSLLLHRHWWIDRCVYWHSNN